MRREGRVRGQPTSKSRSTGRCRSGKTRCRACRDHPVEKSRPKRMGRYKRFATDVHVNPSLGDFCLQPSLKQLRVSSSLRDVVDRETDERFNNACRRHEHENAVVEVGILVATVNSVIDAAFASMPGGSGDDNDDLEIMDETTAMACTPFELSSDGTDTVSVVDEAFHRDLGVFGSGAVDGSSWESVLSEDSWSDVELSESDTEDDDDNDDDDWTMMNANDDVNCDTRL